MNIKTKLITTLLLCSLTLSGHAQSADQPADLLLINGRIYTVNPTKPWVQAMAVKGDTILAIGSNADIASYNGEATQTIDLGEKIVLPGIIDGHLHPAWGGIKKLFQCNFAFTATPEEIGNAIKACVQAQPDSEWIIGGQWTSDFFVNNPIASPRLWLDAVSGGKAVALTDDSGHNHWVNSAALEKMGLDKDSPDPAGGKIVREANGTEPNGLLEEAFAMVNKALPEWTMQQQIDGAAYSVVTANSYGVTGMKDASASPAEVKAFYTLDQAGDLSANVATSLHLGNKGAFSVEDIAELVRLRDQYNSRHVHTNFVKIFLDGVPTASRSAALLEPYLPANPGDPANYGSLHLTPEELADAVTNLDKLGFTVKIHAAGDRSARVALDAVEQARKTNGDSGLRHEIAHAEIISKQDIPRFSTLNVVADFSPYIWFPSPITDSIKGAVGERANYFWPARDLLDSGAPMLAGSDWPSAVPDMNPWTGMEALVTRRDPQGIYPGVLWEEQAISLEEAIEVYTLGGARALKLDATTGSLEAGKSADFIVLQNDLFEQPASAISDTQVDMTFFEGELVYQAEASAAN